MRWPRKRLETAGWRLEESISSQSADKPIEDFGGFDSDRKEFRMLGGAEESESVRKPNLVFDFTT